ncbi:hypothetical protein niasHT_037570 [Heterodera trifolii]|uniref:RNA-directed DNA polymerase n=1 Tax=Heterodera trifolii TaxID=157864 RepID=A0ABD2IA37_9BILA
MAQPTAQELLKLIADQQTAMTQQQQQIAQLLALQQTQKADTVLTLPDVAIFEPSDDKSRISEWLKRAQFTIDCVSPNASDAVKVKAIMNKLSEAAFSEYTKFCLPEPVTSFSLDTTVKKLEKLFAKPQSIFIDRFECLIARKGEGEDFRSFVNRHKRLITDFKFSDLKEQQFYVLMLLTALKSHGDAALRQRILSKLTADGDNITYDAVVEDCMNFMTTIAEAKVIESSSSGNQRNHAVNTVHPKREKPKYERPKSQQSTKTEQQKCWRCGQTNHHHAACPQKGYKCRKCSQNGHIESRCEAVQEWRKKNAKSWLKKNVGNVHIVTVNIGTTAKPTAKSTLLRVKVSFQGKVIEFVLDSGAEVNVINEMTYKLIGSPTIKACKEKAVLYDGSTRSFIGKGTGIFEFNGIDVEQEFYVAGKDSLNLLSIQTMDAFGLLDELKEKISSKRVNMCKGGKKDNAPIRPKGTQVSEYLAKLKKAFPDVFKEELGFCTKAKANLVLKPDTQPIFRKARPVPHNSREVVEKELERLESLQIITKVEHTDWAAPILIVKKADGSARMCIDYSTCLNNALLDHQHHFRCQMTFLRHAYLQIELTAEAKKLCTIATHRGYYQFNRLPFGVKTAPGIFQSVMDKLLAGLEFATAYLDDIIIVSKTKDEHFQNLEKVFDRIQSWGFRVKMDKCSFFQEQIKYLGQIIDKDGRRPDPSKIAAIANMPAPNDVPSLRTFLGMVNHYQQFVKNMRFVRQPLDDLLKKDKDWDWSKECQEAFIKIKEILSSDLLLTHYDPKLEIIVAADASDHGIGAVIYHRFPNGAIKAIEHVSSSLTPAERNYSQIEKEGLALIFAVRKFHKMIYGRKFILQTDHKPLLAIFGNKKGIRQMSANRLLRWSLMLLAYDFEIELIAKSTSPEEDRVIASMEFEKEAENFFINTLETVSLSSKDLISAGNEDETIKKVAQLVQPMLINASRQQLAEPFCADGTHKLQFLNGCIAALGQPLPPLCLKVVSIDHRTAQQTPAGPLAVTNCVLRTGDGHRVEASGWQAHAGVLADLCVGSAYWFTNCVARARYQRLGCWYRIGLGGPNALVVPHVAPEPMPSAQPMPSVQTGAGVTVPVQLGPQASRDIDVVGIDNDAGRPIEECFVIERTTAMRNAPRNTRGEICELRFLPLEDAERPDLLIEALIQHLLDRVLEGQPRPSLIGLQVHPPGFDRRYVIRLRPPEQNNAATLAAAIERLNEQSAAGIDLLAGKDDHQSAGCACDYAAEHHVSHKVQSLIRVINPDDRLCLARAVLLGLRDRETRMAGGGGRAAFSAYAIRQDQHGADAADLLTNAGIALNKHTYTLDDVRQLQQWLTNQHGVGQIWLVVFEKEQEYRIVFKGDGNAARFNLCLLLERAHFNYVGRIEQLFKVPGYCIDCERRADARYHASGCKVACRLCLRFGAGYPCKSEQLPNGESSARRCNECGFVFPCDDCFNYHLVNQAPDPLDGRGLRQRRTLCQWRRFCRDCGRVAYLGLHQCPPLGQADKGAQDCRLCAGPHMNDQPCFIQPLGPGHARAARVNNSINIDVASEDDDDNDSDEDDDDEQPLRFCFFDAETSQDRPLQLNNNNQVAQKHVPLLIVAEVICDRCIKAGISVHDGHGQRALGCVCMCGSVRGQQMRQWMSPPFANAPRDNTPSPPGAPLYNFRRLFFHSFDNAAADPVDQFLDYLTRHGPKNAHTVCIAHNGGKYDFHLVLEALHRRSMPPKRLCTTGHYNV